ncbi:MAG: PhzF family phenazine biosynthesis protein [Candidatus Thorarchaeota archaeon]|nr:PhzF family phenazine biosynthesis protein [Candidatus Thorarchaeota archaeon]
MKSIPYVQTSVFVDEKYPFGGNHLATFWDTSLNKALNKDEMQGIARQLNFSESTFLEEPTMKGCRSKIRIFTPSNELQFAGHPTLGSTFVAKYKGTVRSDEKTILVQLGIGPIRVEYLDSNRIQMSQPAPSFMEEVSDTKKICEAIGLEQKDISTKCPVQVVTTGFPFLIVPISTLSAVQRAVPNPNLILENLKELSTQKILIFTTETVNRNSSVHARIFAPSVGVLEDPATGSAAGPLGAYLEKYNILKGHDFGQPIDIEQGYEVNRPSRLIATIPNESMEEIYVAGRVRLVAEGTFYLN